MDKPRFCRLSEIGLASSDELELHSRLTIKTLLNVKRDFHDNRLNVAIHNLGIPFVVPICTQSKRRANPTDNTVSG